MIVEKYVKAAFREGSAARSRVTTRVHSARRSQREPASIPARTSGREQPSGPGSGSTPCPNRGVAHAPTDSCGLRAPSSGRHKAPSAEALLAFTGSCWRRDGSDCVDPVVSGDGWSVGSWSCWLRFRRQPPRFVAAPLAASAIPIRDAGTTVKRAAEKFIKFLLRSRVGFFAASSGPTALTRGANTLSAWRERPRPWPQAWQAKRPFRVVAHATGLLLATAPAVAPPGGRHRAPPDDDGL